MIFTGTYELTIDPKNRLSIPANIRADLESERRRGTESGEAEPVRLYVVPGDRQGTLSIYDADYYEAYAEKQHSSLEQDQEKEDFEAVFYSVATRLEMDKGGRVVLPQRLQRVAGIRAKVTLTGMRDHMVLWNREAFEQFFAANWSRYPDLLKMSRMKTRQSRGNGAQHGESG